MAHPEFRDERRAPTSREQQAEQRRNQFLDIALDLFSEKGVDGATIKEIAARADVAQGLVYHYFDNKEALLLAVIERHGPFGPIRILLAQVFTQPAREGLHTLVQGFYRIMSERRKLLQIVLHEAMLRQEMRQILLGVRRQLMATVGAYLDAQIAQGAIRPHNTEVTMHTMAVTTASLVLAGLPPHPFLDDLVETLLDGLVTTPTQREPD